jgi:DNA-directed RNA polymerase specialized sigma24 family protein
MLRPYTDQEIIEAFRAGGRARNLAWEFAFKDWKNRVIGSIVQRGGTRDEAKDAIQEAHEEFERRICRPDFVLQRRLSAYFSTCVYRKWVHAKKGRSMDFEELQDAHLAEFAAQMQNDFLDGDLARVLDDTIARLGERCHAILRLFMERHTMREIAEIMGFAGGEQVAKNEKRKCQERYETFLNENPEIKEYIQQLRYDG